MIAGPKKNVIYAVAMSALVALAIGGTSATVAQANDSSYSTQVLESGAAWEDDGPYVLWRSNTDAVVFYLCGGEVKAQPFIVSGRLRFDGFCSDTGIEYRIPVGDPEIEPDRFNNVSQIFAVSDIHGEYEALVDILKVGGVIDDELRWSWGDGHLVVDGDVFDRGDRINECLWLIYRLEREAREAGGRVHYLLGNHELMVMRGDLRYVHQRYIDGVVLETAVKYEDLYGPDMALGRWLRSKHAVVKLNDILFVHGGISPGAVELELNLNELNEAVRRSVDVRSYDLVFDDVLWFVTSNTGPLWYRGYHGDRAQYSAITPKQLDIVLDYYDAGAVVVGHTETDEVARLYDGKVFAVDVALEEIGTLQGLLWADGRWYRVGGNGELVPLGN